ESTKKTKNRLKIPRHVVDNFNKLADERADADDKLPNVPVPRRPWKKQKLKKGDIVFFDVNTKGEVSEIAFSAIWRDGPVMDDGCLATLHNFLPDSELRPFHDKREFLSPWERSGSRRAALKRT
ncbi:hypothetical protein QQ73_07630, partial [Candidatus Endoriftia persephone str. Guaymas]|nr:hypothetical protein [Candidatus Endoriftia persephone str. Guaymas]